MVSAMLLLLRAPHAVRSEANSEPDWPDRLRRDVLADALPSVDVSVIGRRSSRIVQPPDSREPTTDSAICAPIAESRRLTARSVHQWVGAPTGASTRKM